MSKVLGMSFTDHQECHRLMRDVFGSDCCRYCTGTLPEGKGVMVENEL